MSTKIEIVVYRAFLLQSVFDHFPMSEFFNSHACFRQLTISDREWQL
jgi:hypothetical protein